MLTYGDGSVSGYHFLQWRRSFAKSKTDLDVIQNLAGDGDEPNGSLVRRTNTWELDYTYCMM